jgi:RHS repeat-associated protein
VDRFTYYANGLLRTASNETGVISNSYDGANRLIETAADAPGGPRTAILYQQDLAGNVTNAAASSIQYQASYTHDAAERLTSLQFPVSSFQFQYATHNGLVSSVSNAESGLRVEYTYDVLDRPASIVWRKADGSVVRSFGYAYNGAGMITNVARESAAESTAYGYDGLDRLTSAGSSNLVASYSWDLVGNPVQRVENGNTTDYTMGVGDRLAAWTGGAYLFDAAGCVTSITRGADTVAVSWNARHQLTEVSTNGVVAEAFGYDPLGRRAWTAAGGVTNWHVYDGPHVIADLDATGGVVRSFVWGLGIDNLLSFTVHTGCTPQTYFAIKDHLGTPHALVDASGTVVESYRFDPWGRVLGVFDGAGQQLGGSALGNRYLFQGREYCWPTGLYYFRARWHDPVAGRWLSNDPIGISGGLNQYVFCALAPCAFRDPLGLASVDLNVQIPMLFRDHVVGWLYTGRPTQVVNLSGIVSLARQTTAGGDKIGRLVIHAHSGEPGFANFSYAMDQNVSNGSMSGPDVREYLSELGRMMAEDGCILLLECDVGAGPSGTQTLRAIAEVTGVCVGGATESFRSGSTPALKTVSPNGQVTEIGKPRVLGVSKKKFR